METEAPINTIKQSLTEVEAEASENTLADSLAEVKSQIVAETLTDVKGASLSLTFGRDARNEDKPRRLVKHRATWRPRHLCTCLLKRY